MTELFSMHSLKVSCNFVPTCTKSSTQLLRSPKKASDLASQAAEKRYAEPESAPLSSSAPAPTTTVEPLIATLRPK